MFAKGDRRQGSCYYILRWRDREELEDSRQQQLQPLIQLSKRRLAFFGKSFCFFFGKLLCFYLPLVATGFLIYNGISEGSENDTGTSGKTCNMNCHSDWSKIYCIIACMPLVGRNEKETLNAKNNDKYFILSTLSNFISKIQFNELVAPFQAVFICCEVKEKELQKFCDTITQTARREENVGVFLLQENWSDKLTGFTLTNKL